MSQYQKKQNEVKENYNSFLISDYKTNHLPCYDSDANIELHIFEWRTSGRFCAAFLVSGSHIVKMQGVSSWEQALKKVERHPLVKWILDKDKIEVREIKVNASKESEHLSFSDMEWGIYKIPGGGMIAALGEYNYHSACEGIKTTPSTSLPEDAVLIGKHSRWLVIDEWCESSHILKK